MNNTLLAINSELKKEADEILHNRGLLNLLAIYGKPHITGSYSLDLMTWRDLDIYLEVEELQSIDFFELGNEINRALHPVKMSFRNEVIAQTRGLPAGLYWGIYLGNERAGAWKIDVWAVARMECKRLLEYCSNIKQKLTPATIQIILEIKSRCWQDPSYRRVYNSSDIYSAVLVHKVRSIDEFKEYLHKKL
jgi:hypothetical protein